MHINEIIALIPEDPVDEALMSIETVTTFPADNAARIRCNLSNEFRLMVQVAGEGITISAEDRNTVFCSPGAFLSTLRRTIYAIDEALADGSYRQTTPKPNYIVPRPPPPEDMDIPVWDATTGTWWDAEY